ncbi:MAG: FMN-binding protein [Anaerococcus sp.]|uniref:FMN-binding protein n=1 Tax=Anaerococcus sp. TaxID=1872515 RepID=UPI002613F4A1|nr:FMN-binding protein [Anaerococcus sp.]MCI5972070.1 FMN-binding protein [Anaerococcus sp.]
MNNSLKLGLKLFLITSVTAFALALTNNATSPIIEAKAQEKLQESLSVVLPADSYEEVDLADKPASLEKIYKATGADGDGYVFQILSPGGYGGDIEFLIGCDKDHNITGFAPLNHAESAGFGKQMEEDFFKEGMVGVSMDGEVKASESGGENEIVGISGATISTGTILRGINDAASVLGELD